MGINFNLYCYSYYEPKILSITNIFNVIKRTAITGIVAIGMTYVISTGSIDLSVGGQVALIGMIGALLLKGGSPIVIAIILMILLGAFIGLINGFCVTILKFPAFMTTLAMMEITGGFALYLSSGRVIFGLPERYGFFGLGHILGIPVPVIIFVISVIIGSIIMKKFSYGRKVAAVGSNQKGAWYAGINVKLIKGVF